MDENILRRIARKVILDGKLPSRRPDRTWGGPGVGAPCAVCGVSVERDQMEFEIDFLFKAGTGYDDLVRLIGSNPMYVFEITKQDKIDKRTTNSWTPP